MVFHTIGFWLLVLAVPLWAYRWYLVGTLGPRERAMFKRLITQRHESAIKFCLKIFGFLIFVAVGVMILAFGLRYLKYGSLTIGTFRDIVRSRLYSGVDPLDQALDTFHYDQSLPVAIISTCLLISVCFSLVTIGLRDISVVGQIKKRIARLVNRSTASSS